MRRAIMVWFSAVAAVVVLAGPSSAASLKAHTDPNDTDRSPDIRKVWTNQSRHVFFRIATWDHLTHHDVVFNIVLDTRGSNAFDRVIDLDAQRALVSKVVNGRTGAPIGSRTVHGPNGRKVWFRVPSRWLDIEIPVSIKVRTGDFDNGHGPWPDRAPDFGRFVGLQRGLIPDVNGVFLNAAQDIYCTPGGVVGTFRLDTGCWAGFNPLVRFTASR